MVTARRAFPTTTALEALTRLKPMNLYGWSKHLFDLAVIERARNGGKLPPQWVGLKFFNVFGPNEYHKGEMMSLVAKRFDDAKAGVPVQLFKSHRDGIADGEQRRDFIYVDDTVAVMRWLLDHPRVNGIFNVGTGVASSFKEMITALFAALGRGPNIEYIDMPPAIRNSYQYFTQASIDHLRQAGYLRAVHADRCGGEDLRHPPISTLRTGTADVRLPNRPGTARAPHGPVHRRPHARRLRLWRGVAGVARGAGAGDRGAARGEGGRRRRQRRAQPRRPRRALPVRRRDRR